ncbi:MAG TPA: TolC family outer membrane protein, partial [Hyphomicrobiaceae bacterium]|nr:TolC family outer membrane protein [Hyphomicrobiaceae bacterium]
PASAETLLQALASAYKFNPRLDAARATLRATDEEVPRALSGYRPVVTGSADTSYQNVNTKPGSAAAGESNPRGYQVDLVQPLFRGFRTVNAVNAAEATVRAGRETLRLAEQSVLLEAVTAFGDVVRDTAIVRLRENNVTVLTRDLRATQDRFNVGEVTRTDVAQAQARRAAAVAALDLARANLRTSRATYERVIGHPPSNLVEATASRLVAKTLAENVEISLRETPSVVAALYREQAARFSIDLVRGELLPSAQLEANYSKRFDQGQGIDAIESTSVTGRLTVPFYTGGEVEARVRQAKHTHVQRLQEIEQARTEAQAQVVTAWAQLQAAKAAVESDQTAVNANRIALAGVREEERVGQRTLLDVLNAEQELLNSEVNLVTDQRNVVVASYTVLSTIGRLNAQDLSLASLVYDPDAHYDDVRRKWFDVNITHADGRREALPAPGPAPVK